MHNINILKIIVFRITFFAFALILHSFFDIKYIEYIIKALNIVWISYVKLTYVLNIKGINVEPVNISNIMSNLSTSIFFVFKIVTKK